MNSIAHVSGIYLIINTKSNKVYIGQAQDLRRRWNDHKRSLRNGKHHNSYLQHAWDKYGELAFKFQILEYCVIEQLDIREQHFLNVYMPKGLCYNMAVDATSPMRGRKVSEETRARISAANKGRVFSEERNAKISASKLGKKRAPFSEEARRNIGNSARGRKQSEEDRRKKSEAAKRRPPMSAESRQKIVDANKRRPPPSEETRQKLREANSGYVHTNEAKRKISEANKGLKRTPEQRKKMGEARKLKNMLRRLEAIDESINE